MDLRQLDDEVVPRLAQHVQAVRDTVVSAPGPAQALRELDDHYASTGVLRVLRDAPQLLALLAGTVLLAGTGVGVALGQGDRWSQAAAATPPAALGPRAGADAEAHLAEAREATVQAARDAPGLNRLALVSLREQLDVARTGVLVAGSRLQVRRAYVRAPAPPLAELFTVEAGADATRTLSAFLAETARRKAEEQRELTQLARTAPAGSPGAPDARGSYEAAARTAGQEAAAYRADCACVLALVLEGSASELAELLSVPTVRGVQVAPRGTDLDGLDVTPLPPGVTGPVPSR